MRIHQTINNNIVVVIDENGRERIVSGRGIGFRKHSGDTFDERMVEKEFVLSPSGSNKQLLQLLSEIPAGVIDAAMIILDEAASDLNKTLNDGALISLCDHIFTAVERTKENILVKNVLLWEIKKFYPEEFRLGKRALKTIYDHTGVMLSEDEAGFITLHIVNAEMEATVGDMYGLTKIMQEVLNIIKYNCKITLDEESFHYCRFITHLKFFAQRLLTHTTYHGDDNDELLSVVKKQYPQAYQCVRRVGGFLASRYEYQLSEEEQLYLTIHVARLMDKSK